MTKLIDVINSPWAILPEKLEEIQGIYATHLRGERIDIAGVEARLGRPLKNEPKAYEVIDGVAVLPLEGVIAKRMNLFMEISGGTSTQLAARNLRQAMDDPEVHSVIQYVDTPGGTVDGTQNYAHDVYTARGKKPLVTLASGTMASAGYWIGAAADKVYITDLTTVVGSIGVVAKHVDTSGAEQKAGIKTTEVTAGKYKRAASQYEPLTEEGRKTIQDQVDQVYAVFVGDVARFRGVSEETVLADMADGRVFIGQQAIDAGLVDGVSTLEALIEQLNRNRAGVAHRPSLPNTGATSMDLEKLKAEHPQLVQAIEKDAHSAGVAAERARVQAVKATLIPGHEALVERLIADGTPAADAALAVNAAEREIRVKQGDKERAEAPAPARTAPPSTVPGQDDKPAAQTDAERLANLPVDERCKAMWDANTSGVRNQYTSLGAFVAYEKAVAAGKVKSIGDRKAA
jgi:signal peptide peptidase SppA